MLIELGQHLIRRYLECLECRKLPKRGEVIDELGHTLDTFREITLERLQSPAVFLASVLEKLSQPFLRIRNLFNPPRRRQI
jgi:hypothetical protein